MFASVTLCDLPRLKRGVYADVPKHEREVTTMDERLGLQDNLRRLFNCSLDKRVGNCSVGFCLDFFTVFKLG